MIKIAQETLTTPPPPVKPVAKQPAKPAVPAPVAKPAPEPHPFEEFGRSSDMNYLLAPDGREVHVPGMTHVGEAQKIVKQMGIDMDPDLALDYLLKQGWIRVSGDVFEMHNFARAKGVISKFLSNHNDYYQNVSQLEIDNRAKGWSKYVDIRTLYNPDFNPESEAAERADKMRRLRGYAKNWFSMMKKSKKI
jgi:hypothetical protein